MFKKILNDVEKGEIHGIRSRLCIAVKNGKIKKAQVEMILNALEKNPDGKELFLSGVSEDRKQKREEWSKEYLEYLFEREISFGINRERLLHMAEVAEYVYRYDNLIRFSVIIVIGILLVLLVKRFK